MQAYLFKDFENEPKTEEQDYLPQDPIYKKYFKGTIPLKDNFKNPELKIVNGCRLFRTREKEGGYDEVFLTEKQKIFAGISPQISFIFPPNNRVTENRIGFRFYRSNPISKAQSDIPYFTLVNISFRKFIILEKDSDIKDANGKKFINLKLDCFEIIQTIIKNKFIYKNDFDDNFPLSVIEILGFCYASRKKIINDKIKILEPYFPDDFNPDEMKEIYEETKSILYLEPILCNNHASVLAFYFIKEKNNRLTRKNIIFDMSSCHYDNIKKYDPIFKKEMSYNLVKFPKQKIQNGPSCSIWFVSTLTLLMQYNFNSVLFENNKFLFQIIKNIEKIMNIDDKEITVDFKKIKDREIENISSNYFISYNIVFNPFIDIKEFMIQCYEISYSDLFNILEYYQNKFSEFRKKIVDLKLNFHYYQMTSDFIKVSQDEINILEKKYYIARNNFYELVKKALKIHRNQVNHQQEEPFLNKFIKENEKLKSFIEQVLNEKNIEFILFTRKQFNSKLVTSNDLFVQLLDN